LLLFFICVLQHFVDFFDDQFDFHQYAMRKLTLRAYVKMLKYEDEIRGHRFFFKAACGAVETYLSLLTKKDKPAASTSKPAEGDGISEEEQKKALSKQRKAEAKAKATSSDKEKEKDKGTQGKKDSKEGTKKVDPDPEGNLYLKGDSLNEASKFLVPLLQFHSSRIETHRLAIDVYTRKREPLFLLSFSFFLFFLICNFSSCIQGSHWLLSSRSKRPGLLILLTRRFTP